MTGASMYTSLEIGKTISSCQSASRNIYEATVDNASRRLLDSQDVKVTESTLRMLNNLLRDSEGRQ